MIFETEKFSRSEFNTQSFVTTTELITILDKYDEFKEELLKLYQIDTEKPTVLKIGNARQLLASVNNLDTQGEKIDIVTKVKDVHIYKLLEAEKALFEIFGVKDPFILKKNESDLLIAETRYSAKNHLLDNYNLSKFANYCRDEKYDDLVYTIKDYLKVKNSDNENEQKLRIVYKHDEEKFYIRAKTSDSDYKNFGINFSVFVALVSLNSYVEKTKNEIYINNYIIDDSNLYISFAIKNVFQISDKMSLSFNLILENDEIKRNAVSFNGIFQLTYIEKEQSSSIIMKPNGFRRENVNYPTDLLTYEHRGNVKNVFKKIQEMPTLIDHYISQIKVDAEKISRIKHPNDVKDFLYQKIKLSKKPEFKEYKTPILNKLMNISADTIFQLFEKLQDVEQLFGHDDVVSKDFWRNKLYQALVEGK